MTLHIQASALCGTPKLLWAAAPWPNGNAHASRVKVTCQPTALISELRVLARLNRALRKRGLQIFRNTRRKDIEREGRFCAYSERCEAIGDTHVARELHVLRPWERIGTRQEVRGARAVAESDARGKVRL